MAYSGVLERRWREPSDRVLELAAFFLVRLALVVFIILSAGPGVPSILSAELPRKQALLIANSSYRVEQLRSPRGDAQALERALRSNGFTVQIHADLDKRSMQGAVSEFARGVGRGDVAFFYFSGFGLTSVGQTFLLATDAEIAKDIDIWKNGLSVKTILEWLAESAPGAIVVAVDAARVHPGERLIRPRSSGLDPDIGSENTLTIYSASPGKLLEGDDGDSSLFGKELAAEISRSGIEATDAFNRVRLSVAKQSNGTQVPLVTSTLARPLFFAGGGAGPGAEVQRPQATGSPTPAVAVSEPSTRVTPAVAEEVPAANRVEQTESGVIRDCSKCPLLVVLPAGQFRMGSKRPYQGPEHDVSIKRRFAIGRYEVSFDEWDACVSEKGCEARPQDLDWGRGANPVINVSWTDAKQYVAWLSKKTGQSYRLPSEAEWEYAARAGTRTTYWWGGQVGNDNANCVGCRDQGDDRPRKVGSYAANPFGLHDTAGNVAEWVEDCWNSSFRGAPSDGSAWLEGDCRVRVLRGGSFDSDASQVSSSFRFRYDANVPYSANGFRVVRDLE